jgi:hypothetical protein
MAAMDSVWGSDHLQRNEVFSSQIKEMFQDQVFASQWVRMITDFGDGENYRISSIGELTMDQMSESVALAERRPDTGQYIFNVNEFVGVKVPYTDKFLEDDFLASAAISATPRKMKRAFDVYYETQTLKLHRVQTSDNPNTINDADHRILASGTGRTFVQNDFAYARFALLKAKAPLNGLIAVVDPSMEFNQSILSTLTSPVEGPRWGQKDGMDVISDGVRFLMTISGFDVYVSDYLDTATVAEAALREYDGSTGSGSSVGDKFNMFFTVAGDDAKPFIGAWRRQPTIKSWRDEDVETEYHQLSARFGLNLYRPESLVTIVSSTTLN